MPGKVGQRGPDIAPAVRGALIRALRFVEDHEPDDPMWKAPGRDQETLPPAFAGKSLSEIFAIMIAYGRVEEVLSLVAKFCPKDVMLGTEQTPAPIQLPSEHMAEVIQLVRERRAAGSVQPVDGQAALGAPGGAAGSGVSDSG